MTTEHGVSQIFVENDVIFLEFKGAFNLEGAVKISKALKSTVEIFGQRSFKLLVDYSEAEGATPEAYQEVSDCNAWLNTQKMKAKAVIIHSAANTTILNGRSPERKVQNSRDFTDKTSAIDWLNTYS